MNKKLDVKKSVLERYSQGAKSVQAELCCPVDYDKDLLKILPQEIIDRDYGCGDPSRYVREGDVVLDLGSGGGKICYMAAQITGDKGRVIGVDMNMDMLGLARSYQDEMAGKLGRDIVDFRKGYIQDLALDVEAMEKFLCDNPVTDLDSMDRLNQWKLEQRNERPLVESGSVDIVVSNCVLNLVAEQDRRQMIEEIYRVLKPGGRIAISDIIADEYVPEALKNDSELWSGCISGAFQEEAFLDAFLEAGFVQLAYDKWDAQPWQVVEGFEFRSATVVARKPLHDNKDQADDAGHALIYKGPFAEVIDDRGNRFPRAKRIAVSEQLFNDISASDIAGLFVAIPGSACCKKTFDLASGTVREFAETKGKVHESGTEKQSGSGGCC